MEQTKQAILITIGDELLIGQVVDTNSAFIAEELGKVGVRVRKILSVQDNEQEIMSAISSALLDVDVVITTGGLGPTKDDITKATLCKYFHTQLVENSQVREHIQQLYAQRPDILNRLTATQWQVPANCIVLPNRVGSAPVMMWQTTEDKYLFCLPGVPCEMEIAIVEQILPILEKRCISACSYPISHRTLLVSGIPESALAILIEDWENQLPATMQLAYLPKAGTIRLRLSTYGKASSQEIDAQINKLLPLLQPYLLAVEDKPLEVLLGEKLLKNQATISTAESCTGGRLAALLNAHPGSSNFYYGSVISYDNSVKQKLLAVHAKDLQEHGAVSKEVVTQMASAVRCLLHTDYAIATSGIAGPSGGSTDKPVGTVWIAWATPEGTTAQCFHLGRVRSEITARACTMAIIGMLKLIH